MKNRIRDIAGPLWPTLVRGRTRVARVAKAALGARAFALAERRRRSLAIDLDRPVGMGGLIAHALLLHAWAEDAGTQLEIRASSPLYGDGRADVFRHWFERGTGNQTAPLGLFASEYLIRHRAPQHVPLDRAYALMAAHFRPSAILSDAIEAAAASIGPYDTAIHFRGTDKVLDSGKVDYRQMFAASDDALRQCEGEIVFLATDDPGFADALRKRHGGITFASYDIGEVPEGMPRHFSSLAPEDKAREALVNIWLISRATRVFRTSSYLSSISRLLNPAQKTVTINRTILAETPFPEQGVLEQEARERGTGQL